MSALSAVDSVEVTVTGIDHSYGHGPVLAGVSVVAAPASTLVLLGPSGCGKTTLLRVIAGLERPQRGSVRIGGTPVADDNVFVPPERRRVGMVFQDGALFSHLSVRANVAFGLGRRADPDRVTAALELVGLEDLGDRRPSQLSGGQRQRVAVARALAPEPAVLLFDEPFASLDAGLRVELRSQIKELLAQLGITSIVVTHDQDEAFVLGDEVAVMRDGHVLQQDDPAAVYASPVDPWVAGFVGEANMLAAGVAGPSTLASTPLGDIPLLDHAPGGDLVLVRPEHVDVGAGRGGVVEAVDFYGHDTVYRVRVGGVPVMARVGAAPAHRVGDQVAVRYCGPPTRTYVSEHAPSSEDQGR